MAAIPADASVSLERRHMFHRDLGCFPRTSLPLEERPRLRVQAFISIIGGIGIGISRFGPGRVESDDGEGWFPLRKFGLFLGEDLISNI